MNTPLPRGTDFERALLGAAELDEPDPAALGRVARALGVGGVLLAPATASALGASGAAAASAAAPMAVAGTAIWLKPLLLGSLLGTLATSTVHLVRAPASKAIVHAASAPTTMRREPPKAATNPPLARFEPAAAPAISVEPRPVVASRPVITVTPRSESGAPALAAAPADAVAREVKAIDRARDAMQAGSPLLAIDLLEAYRREWPSGMLGIEATVLGIEARFAAGQRELAAHQARTFLATQGESRYAARLRALIGSEIKFDSGRH
jgi:hypothetical protein